MNMNVSIKFGLGGKMKIVNDVMLLLTCLLMFLLLSK